MPLIRYWDKFRDEFANKVNSLSSEVLSTAWISSKNRTKLYEDTILKIVAERMDLVYVSEEFKIDYTFCKPTETGYKVPLIFIESENNAFDAAHEIRKLCCLSAPLKILITCVEWCDEKGYWRNGGYKKQLTEQWSSIISCHNQVWPQPSVIGVLVGEKKDEVLRYYSMLFGSDGNILNDSEVLLEKIIS